MPLLQKIIARPVAVSMIMLIITATGIYSAFLLPLELTPEAELPRLSVHTNWPNASPATVEAFITAPIEGVVAALPGIVKLTSTSREGQSQVDVEFSRDIRVDFASMQLSEQLALVRESLPHNASSPRIEKYVPEEFRQEAFLLYQFSGPYSLYEIRQLALNRLRNPLLAIPGIADVRVQGGQDAEIHILLDRQKMANLGLSPSQIQDLFSGINSRTQGGVLVQEPTQTDLMVVNPVNTLPDLRNLPVNLSGRTIHLGDIATIEQAYQNVSQLVRVDNNPTVVLTILREPGTNTISVANDVFKRLAELIAELPPGVQLLKISDESEEIRSDLQALSSRSLFCLVVIFLVLMAFMRSIKLPLLVMSTVAFAILLTINLFYFFGLTLNILTLAGLALGFGMLVDNAIVVIDNIHRLQEEGVSAVRAGTLGTKEMFLPLLAGTATTVVVFLPFLYLTGELRIFYLPFTTAVCLSLIASLFITFLFIPTVGTRASRHKSPAIASREGIYVKCLKWTTLWPLLTIALTGVIFYVSYQKFDKYVTRGEIWRWGGSTYLVCRATLPKGAQLQRADDIARKFEEKVVGLEGVERVTTNVFPERVNVRIAFPEKVSMTAYPLILKEQLTVMASKFAGVGIAVFGFGPGFSSSLGGSMPNFRIQVLGYNFGEVRRIAEDFGRKLERNARVRDVNTSGSGRYWGTANHSESVLIVHHENLAKYGLTVKDVLDHVSAYLHENQYWQRIRLAGQEYDYRVKFADFEDFDLQDLYQLSIQTPHSGTVRLQAVASIVEQPVQSEIVRENQQYQRWVTFEYRGPYRYGQQMVDSVIENTILPPGYKIHRPDFFLSAAEKEEILTVLALSVVLVFMVIAALYESLIQPIIIILTVPLALIGVFLIFWLSDTNFDRSAYIGVILLSGIVVNNAILMVERINRLSRDGMSVQAAIIAGAQQRFRPILMTTMTTVFGLLPLVASGGESRLWGTLALATIGGLTTSAILVLFVTPAMYKVLHRKG